MAAWESCHRLSFQIRMGGFIMRHVRFILAVFTALFLAACQPPGGTDGLSAALGEPFDLPFGQTARIEEAGLEIRFVDVTEDSRCPTNTGIQCVWAGRAVMLFEATQDGGAPESVTATLEGGLSQPVSTGGYTLTVNSLSPEPGAGADVPEDRYVARVTVQGEEAP